MARAELTLGSASPRRAALLQRLNVAFEVVSIDIDESVYVRHGDPTASVRAIAAAKFAALAPTLHSARLLTADTLVSVDDQPLGKPHSANDLREMLAKTSGRCIFVDTAVCVGPPNGTPAVASVRTSVTLRELAADEIDRYIETGAGMDKAGGLALQAEASHFITVVDGCWSNVVGLPLCAVADLLGHAPSTSSQRDRCSIDLCGSSTSQLR